MRALLNPRTTRERARAARFFTPADYAAVEAFYAARPDLTATPLRARPELAAELGLAALSIKDETGRHGVEAFKIVGARYALHRLGHDVAARGVVCATAGNHGRAVARAAHDAGIACTVFVPAPRDDAHAAERRTRQARVEAMRRDGARVIDVHGSYEEAVQAAAEYGATRGATVVSDTSWPGYETVPRWIMAGYTHIFEEARTQWDERPDIVIVQAGVGGLAGGAAAWAAYRFGIAPPRVVVCEPDDAACVLESAAAGAPISLPGPLRTIMAGLRCGEPSPAAWSAIEDGVDAFVTVPDTLVLETIEHLRAPGGGDASIAAGPSGACGVAALSALMRAPELADVRRALHLGPATRVLAIVTEGP